MIHPLYLTLLVACEQVAPTGNPLEAVVVDASAPVAETQAELAPEEEEETPFSISSEELATMGPGASVTSVSPEAKVDPPSSQTPPPPPPPPVQAAPPAPLPPTTSQGWPQTLGKAWPVRLVTTVPNASPPRAILGLPNGKEVVVNPGSMVPELGLVVVAISPGSAELAKIVPAGDHATIESVTLRSQY
jgi:hypothetical protein